MKLEQFLAEEDKLASLLQKQGKSKHKEDDKYCPVELEIGVKVEVEHTKDKAAAKEIAKDHLEENPHYYTGVLARAEKDTEEKAQDVVKKHGYKNLDDYRKKKKIGKEKV